VEYSFEIGFLHIVPLLFGHFEERSPRINAGIIYEDVDAPKLFQSVSDCSTDAFGATNVDRKRESGSSPRSNVIRHCGSPISIEIQNKHLSALIPEKVRDCLTNARRRSSNDRYLAL
jgi:hypothetical protein